MDSIASIIDTTHLKVLYETSEKIRARFIVLYEIYSSDEIYHKYVDAHIADLFNFNVKTNFTDEQILDIIRFIRCMFGHFAIPLNSFDYSNYLHPIHIEENIRDFSVPKKIRDEICDYFPIKKIKGVNMFSCVLTYVLSFYDFIKCINSPPSDPYYIEKFHKNPIAICFLCDSMERYFNPPPPPSPHPPPDTITIGRFTIIDTEKPTSNVEKQLAELDTFIKEMEEKEAVLTSSNRSEDDDGLIFPFVDDPLYTVSLSSEDDDPPFAVHASKKDDSDDLIPILPNGCCSTVGSTQYDVEDDEDDDWALRDSKESQPADTSTKKLIIKVSEASRPTLHEFEHEESESVLSPRDDDNNYELPITHYDEEYFDTSSQLI